MGSRSGGATNQSMNFQALDECNVVVKMTFHWAKLLLPSSLEITELLYSMELLSIVTKKTKKVEV